MPAQTRVQDLYSEVRVGKTILAITIDCAGRPSKDFAITVTRASVRVDDRGDGAFHAIVPLPVNAEPSRRVVRYTRGVIDVLVARATSH